MNPEPIMPTYSLKTYLSLAVPALLLMASPSLAQDTTPKPQYYGSAGLGAFQYDPTESNIPMLSLKGGVKLNSYFGLEAELNSGLGKDKGAKLSSQKSVYGVGYLPINPKFQLLGRMGFSDTDLKASSKIDGGGGVSLGVGAQYDLNDQTALRFDFTNTDAKDDRGQSSSVGLNLVRKF